MNSDLAGVERTSLGVSGWKGFFKLLPGGTFRTGKILFLLTGLLLIFALVTCASQRKHHRAVPCPCEKQNKR